MEGSDDVKHVFDGEAPSDDDALALTRSNASVHSGTFVRGRKQPATKRPHFSHGADDEEDDSDDQPDLGDYFSQWDIPPKDIILMCRAYASYLSAQNREHPKK